MRPGGARRGALLALLAWTLPAVAEGAAPARGGEALFPALEAAEVAAVVVMDAPRALDPRSFAASARVETPLVGAARGDVLLLAWEERSPQRAVRFAAGQRVLLALERLPAHSIWATRIPEPARRARHWTPARRGAAFVRDPEPGAVTWIEHYLALPPALREANPGVAHLGWLAAAAREELAVAALERLREVDDLDAALDETSARRVASCLGREEHAVAEAALALVEARAPRALAAPVDALATPDARGPAAAYAARARLEGGLPAPLGRALLAAEASPDHRRVGARQAAPELAARLPGLLRRDPVPAVRIAALERLVELEGVAALDRVLFALGDPDPDVRAAAVESVGALGDAAVPSLRGVAWDGSPEAGRSAVLALRATGSAGHRVLAEIADGHPDASLRLAAELALGRAIGHRH